MKILVSIMLALGLVGNSGCLPGGGGCGPGGCTKFVQTAEEAAHKTHKHEVVVIFYADWCGPCKNMSRQVWPAVMQTIRQNYRGVVFVDGDKRPDLMRAYGVRSYPSVLIVDIENEKRPKIVKRFVGARSINFVRDFLK